ncbi:MAG: metallophosphoesterase [Chitinophagaceae bacterium]|nr:metallophosphoesterase [Chitinophagaceae bacterium]
MAKVTRPRGNNTHKVRRPFGDPVEAPKPHHRFIPIPGQFAKPADLVLKLESVLSKPVMDKIKQNNQLAFHLVGDTGGVNGTDIQDALANQMEKQIQQSGDADKPAFFYHVGDVVYYNGISEHYEEQFYDPYKYYPTYIFAIPGNHDCDTKVNTGDQPDTEPSLLGFMTNFCDPTPSYGPYSPYRKTMNQPWPYWVLDTPYAVFVGLFSNVDGSLDADGDKTQFDWFVQQLKNAPKSKCLIVTMHHPPFSLDSVHGGYPAILDDIDKASQKAGRNPDIVFSGHVHNYQRFTRKIKGKSYPFIVTGAGGYADKPGSMHRMQLDQNNDQIATPFQTTRADLVLNYYNQTNPGYLKMVVDKQFIHGAYYVINFDGSKPPTSPDDEFKFDWKNNKPIPLV